MEPKWITVARTYLGTKEGKDDADNPIVVASTSSPAIRKSSMMRCRGARHSSARC